MPCTLQALGLALIVVHRVATVASLASDVLKVCHDISNKSRLIPGTRYCIWNSGQGAITIRDIKRQSLAGIVEIRGERNKCKAA